LIALFNFESKSTSLVNNNIHSIVTLMNAIVTLLIKKG